MSSIFLPSLNSERLDQGKGLTMGMSVSGTRGVRSLLSLAVLSDRRGSVHSTLGVCV